ncbi:nucleoside hydrolase-like isoform X2 [Achroia grisella]|nr:nucleoside hydrolase-like isoform X2 [Achroia grisella]
MAKESKIVIDNDAGGDDAMAIFLALLYEKHFNGPKLIALTTVNGNTNEENVYKNNQKILKVANRQDVPIYRGSQNSLVVTPDGGNYFGFDGLGDAGDVYADLVPCKEESAAVALIELSKKHKDELTVITIGPVTNVAVAIKLDSGFLDRIAHLYVGAGHIHSDEHSDPEFNTSMDVEAYHVIAQNASPSKVTFFPFSQVMKHLNLSTAWREEVLGAIDTDIIKAQNKYEQVVLKLSDRWQALDPATIAVAIKPDLVEEYQYSNNDVTLCGDKRGITTNKFVPKTEANARIIHSVKEEEYKQFLLDVFLADKKLQR